MKRKRRTPQQAKIEILQAAEKLVLENGPNFLTLKRVAAEMKLSHPAILHHFGSAEQLMIALQQKMSRSIREDFINVLSANQNPDDRLKLIDQFLQKLSNPRNGRMMAFLIASGVDPFPSPDEKGLDLIFANLHKDRDYNPEELKNTLHLILLSMYAEGMMGNLLRKRLGTDQTPTQFRHWLLRLVGTNLQ
jgi:TetR/AcrR family transcriptional regulator, repressor for neighboring sulfatase